MISGYGETNFTPRCPQCNLLFRNEEKRRKHVYMHHLIDRRNKCTFCGLRFNSPSELNKHALLRHQDTGGRYNVQGQNNGRGRQGGLTDNRNFYSKCFDCGYWFPTKEDMWDHKYSEHNMGQASPDMVPTANRFDPLYRQGNFGWE